MRHNIISLGLSLNTCYSHIFPCRGHHHHHHHFCSVHYVLPFFELAETPASYPSYPPLPTPYTWSNTPPIQTFSPASPPARRSCQSYPPLWRRGSIPWHDAAHRPSQHLATCPHPCRTLPDGESAAGSCFPRPSFRQRGASPLGPGICHSSDPPRGASRRSAPAFVPIPSALFLLRARRPRRGGCVLIHAPPTLHAPLAPCRETLPSDRYRPARRGTPLQFRQCRIRSDSSEEDSSDEDELSLDDELPLEDDDLSDFERRLRPT
mmetsp:Transcript_22115/g.41781  ORF Transcript_22115/g.41781 Transcript_22115/m.41781 type:complete len:264 (-) Transcript_22115:680-1471(-)